jgi:hypothetical protein
LTDRIFLNILTFKEWIQGGCINNPLGSHKMTKEKIREKARELLQTYLTKGSFCYHSHPKLLLALNSFFGIIDFTLKEADFKVRIRKFDAAMKNDKNIEIASDDFFLFLNMLILPTTAKKTEATSGAKEKASHTRYGISKVGKEGRSGAWDIYREAEQILFSTENFLKKMHVKMLPSEFLGLIQSHAKGEGLTNKYDVTIRRALTYCIVVFSKIFNIFLDKYNPTIKKHREAVTLLFGASHAIGTDNSGKGNKVTLGNIKEAVGKVRDHVKGKQCNKSTRFYQEKRFYYLAFLARNCNTWLKLADDPARTKAIREITDILKPFPPYERDKITKIAIDNLTFGEMPLNLLFPQSKKPA